MVAFPDYKGLRNHPVDQESLVHFVNHELMPLLRQERAWLQAIRGSDLGHVWTLTSEDDGSVGADWQPVTAETVSPLTTKGDIWGYDTADARIPVGSMPGMALTPNSGVALGVEWRSLTSDEITNSSSESGTTVSDAIDNAIAHTIGAGAGLTGGGALSTNPTIDVVAADNTITVNADSIQANISELESQLDQGLEEVLIVNDDANGQLIQGIASLQLESAGPYIEVNETDAGVNEKISRHLWAIGGSLFFATRTDAGGAGSSWMSMTRIGSTPLQINALVDLDMNANGIVGIGGLDWTGTISSSGDMNVASGFTLYGRDNADSVDLSLLQHDAASDDLILGSVATEQGGTTVRGNGIFDIELVTAGVPDYRFTGSVLDVNANTVTDVGGIVWTGVTSTAGDMDLPHGWDAYFRNQADSADLRWLDLGNDANNRLTLGNSTGDTYIDGSSVDVNGITFTGGLLDTNGADIRTGTGDVVGESNTESRLIGFAQMRVGGWDTANAPSAFAEGAVAYCADGDAGNPCMALYWNGAWRVWLDDTTASALTAISAT